MSETPEKNHYATLGVERTADLRAIKKAYFGLVRQFPPETHAEEFKAIRAAYEVLSDPAARDRYDEEEKSFREYDDEVAAVLAAVEELSLAGKDDEVEAALVAAIEAHPDVLLLRERLAVARARRKDHVGALKAIDELVKRAPETARYHLLRGLALRALDRQADAERALRRAHELAPEDEGIFDALIHSLTRNDHENEALALLDAAAAKVEPGSRAGLALRVQKVHVLFQSNRAEEGELAIDELVKLAREANDPDVSRQIAADLGGPAAGMFASHRFLPANRILERCGELCPENIAYRQFPRKTTLETGELPESALSWLAARELATDGPTIRHPPWGSKLWAVVAIGGLLLLAHVLLHSAGGEGSPAGALVGVKVGELPFTITGTGAIVMAALFAVVAWLGLYFVDSQVSARRSPIQGLTTVHPLYVIRADPERTEIYPLLRLTRSGGTHHHQNGAYTHTAIDLHFDGALLTVIIRDASFAQAWLDHVLATRVRALELLAAGYLDADPHVEAFPPTLLDAGVVASGPRPLWRRRRAWLPVAGGVAAALWGASLLVGLSRRDEVAFAEALKIDTGAAYEAYLAERPEGEFAADARRARDRKVDSLWGDFDRSLDPKAAGAEAFGAAVKRAAAETRGDLPIAISVSPGSSGVAQGELDSAFERLVADMGVTLKHAGAGAVDPVLSRGGGGVPAMSADCGLAREGDAGGVVVTCKVRVGSAGGAEKELSIQAKASAEAGERVEARGVYSAFRERLYEELGLTSVEEARLALQASTGSAPHGK
ncbi:MAG: DnaJ domain-containing protein [Polyangiaceae bacterium]